MPTKTRRLTLVVSGPEKATRYEIEQALREALTRAVQSAPGFKLQELHIEKDLSEED